MSFKLIVREFLESVGSDLTGYTSDPPTVVSRGEYGATLLTPSHIQFAKYGRGAGKQPPLDPLLEWVTKKKFQFRDDKGRFRSYRSTAWAIVKSIGRKGTLNYVANAPNAIEEAIADNLQAYYKKMDDFVADKFSPEFHEIYKTLYPKKITTKL